MGMGRESRVRGPVFEEPWVRVLELFELGFD